MSMRVFATSVAITSKASDQDLLGTITDLFNTETNHQTLSGVDFTINSVLVSKLVS